MVDPDHALRSERPRGILRQALLSLGLVPRASRWACEDRSRVSSMSFRVRKYVRSYGRVLIFGSSTS